MGNDKGNDSNKSMDYALPNSFIEVDETTLNLRYEQPTGRGSIHIAYVNEIRDMAMFKAWLYGNGLREGEKVVGFMYANNQSG